MTSAHLYIKLQIKTIHAEHTHNIYNIRYNITKLVGQLHDFEKTCDDTVHYKSNKTVNFCGFRCATTLPITVFINFVFICPIAIAYSMGQIIKSVCICQSVSLSVCPSASTLTIAFLD